MKGGLQKGGEGRGEIKGARKTRVRPWRLQVGGAGGNSGATIAITLMGCAHASKTRQSSLNPSRYRTCLDSLSGEAQRREYDSRPHGGGGKRVRQECAPCGGEWQKLSGCKGLPRCSEIPPCGSHLCLLTVGIPAIQREMLLPVLEGWKG